MKLNELNDNPGARHRAKRRGRGVGSGLGKTSGRGVKGQKARSGVAVVGFEGGQMPIYRRLPKRGFNNIHAKSFNEINLGRLQQAIDAKLIDAGSTVTVDTLVAAGVLSRRLDGVRLLGNGELKSKISIEVNHASKSARAAVEKAGGSLVIVGGPSAEAGEAAS
ncbi:50S ribosomal protein L15 [Rhodoligotrophos defluvii]|uniref:50S ribosomal protein L15 n=1 Tax=Rhodoligotrophos defluvii TaxID=2561934 RepID=UPI0010C9D3E3|nr:50S ribosomal protein L15 [Rhodoligotrophos defluvii]